MHSFKSYRSETESVTTGTDDDDVDDVYFIVMT